VTGDLDRGSTRAVALKRHGRASCRDGDCSVGATSTLPAVVRLAHGSEWHLQLLVRPRARHRVAKGVERLDDKRRPLPRPSDRGSAGCDHVSASAACDPRLRGHLRIGTEHAERDRVALRPSDPLPLLRRHLRRRRRVRAGRRRARSRVLGDRAHLLRLAPDTLDARTGTTRPRPPQTAAT